VPLQLICEHYTEQRGSLVVMRYADLLAEVDSIFTMQVGRPQTVSSDSSSSDSSSSRSREKGWCLAAGVRIYQQWTIIWNGRGGMHSQGKRLPCSPLMCRGWRRCRWRTQPTSRRS
jgi:hypothetical protein